MIPTNPKMAIIISITYFKVLSKPRAIYNFEIGLLFAMLSAFDVVTSLAHRLGIFTKKDDDVTSDDEATSKDSPKPILEEYYRQIVKTYHREGNSCETLLLSKVQIIKSLRPMT